MVARAPIALTPYLLVVRLLLFVACLPAGIHGLSMVEYAGADAVEVRRLERPASTDETSAPEATTPAPEVGSIEARALYRRALQFEALGLGNPVLLAWIATLLQLIGGSLLLPGLFCRVWGLGLAVVVTAGFILDVWPLLSAMQWPTLELTTGQYDSVVSHLGLFGLALGLLVCGGGRFSLDRLIFAPRHRVVQEHDELYDDDDDEA